MALLPPSERAAALRYYHVRDAKMSLASSLLKHLALAQLLPSLPWHDTCVTRDPVTTKPIFTPPTSLKGTLPGVSFNVTHQAGVVALIAARFPTDTDTPRVDVGVDIVCTSERRSRDIDVVLSTDGDGDNNGNGDGWSRFVDMHSDVFSARETVYLKHHVLSAVPGLVSPSSPSSSGNSTAEAVAVAVADAKLRAFYALWALREAYVKLTGDALLAAWLKDLEFREFRPVAPTAGWDVPAREGGDDSDRAYGAQVINRFEIYLKGKPVEDVNMSLRAMGTDFMICSAVRTPGRPEVGLGLKLRPYRVLDLYDMLDFAESKMEESEGSWP